jgi:hypothetical protein
MTGLSLARLDETAAYQPPRAQRAAQTHVEDDRKRREAPPHEEPHHMRGLGT